MFFATFYIIANIFNIFLYNLLFPFLDVLLQRCTKGT